MKTIANISALEKLQSNAHTAMGYSGIGVFNVELLNWPPRLEYKAEADQIVAKIEDIEENFLIEEAANNEDIRRSSDEIAELQTRIKMMESNTESLRFDAGYDYRKLQKRLGELDVVSRSKIPGFEKVIE